MKSLFTNWEERNKFLAKRFFVRKWYMQVKKLKERDNALENAMKEMDKMYPEYLYAKHKGYPTKAHIKICREIGMSPIQRKTFKF